MESIVFALLAIGISLFGYRIFQRYQHQTKIQYLVDQHLDLIRQQNVLIKPDIQPNTYSGNFAGRLYRFTFGLQVSIRAELTINLTDDELWIYPVKHPFKSDKFKQKLERNRAWSSNKLFDEHYIVAGRPRHFAYAVIRSSRRTQDRLLEFSRSIITAKDNHITYYPHLRNMNTLTSDDWYSLLSLVADLADSIEDMYEQEMFSGIEVDETAHPDHSTGHT